GLGQLSLLLLLSFGQVRLLSLVQKLGPLFICREFLVWGKHCLRRCHPHSNLELSFRSPFHHAHGGWNVSIIAPDGGTNMFVTCQSIDCWIETDPANPWEKSFHPCMRRTLRNG